MTRLAPIAVNGRGFVEEWLEMLWSEAAMQTASESRARMQTFHARYEQEERSADAYVSRTYGPVTACIPPKEFQVEMNVEASGGRELPEFFRIRERGNRYELRDEIGTGDARCKGRNLLPMKQ